MAQGFLAEVEPWANSFIARGFAFEKRGKYIASGVLIARFPGPSGNPLTMATSEAVPQSMISWLLASLGAAYSIALPLVGVLCFLLTLLILWRGRGPMAAAALLLVVHTPLMLGLYAGLQGMLSSYMVIATSPSAPKPSDMAMGISTALVAPMIGLAVMTPSYLIAIVGAIIRSLTAAKPNDA